MPLGTEQIFDRHADDSRRRLFQRFLEIQDSADIRMLDATSDRGGERGGVADGGGHSRAVVRFVAGSQAVDSFGSFLRVELGGILQAEHSQLALLGAEPALVPDVRVTAALIDRREYPLHVLWSVPDGIQPGPIATVRLDVAGGVTLRNFGEPAASGIEAASSISAPSNPSGANRAPL